MKKKSSFTHNSVEVKIKAVLEILEDKKPVKEVADNLNLHRDTVYRWINAYKEDGESGLENPKALTATSKTDDDSKKVKELNKKLKEKEMEIEILKKFQAFLKENEKAKNMKLFQL